MTLYDRYGKVAIRAWGDNTYYGGGSDCLNVLDHRTGQRRRAVLQDVREAVTLMDALPEIEFVMSQFLPQDVDPRVYDRYQMEVMLNNTTRPIIFVSPDFEGCVAAVEMCEIVAGSTSTSLRGSSPTLKPCKSVCTWPKRDCRCCTFPSTLAASTRQRPRPAAWRL
jgi:trimethylamine--corrinoid protein Co-methyltransferase